MRILRGKESREQGGGRLSEAIHCSTRRGTRRDGRLLELTRQHADMPTSHQKNAIAVHHFSSSIILITPKMPSNRLNKVQKHIAKKKGKNVSLHENSRDSHRLQRASARDDKLNRLASVREKQNRPYGELAKPLDYSMI